MEQAKQAMRYPNIEAERARLSMSYEQMAGELGVTRKTVYNWIRAGKIPQKSLEQMSHMFNCTIDYLLGRSDKAC